jgi:hypothetical protein
MNIIQKIKHLFFKKEIPESQELVAWYRSGIRITKTEEGFEWADSLGNGPTLIGSKNKDGDIVWQCRYINKTGYY